MTRIRRTFLAVIAATLVAAASAAATAGSATMAMPSAAKVMAEKGIDPASVAGTGRDGRITKARAGRETREDAKVELFRSGGSNILRRFQQEADGGQEGEDGPAQGFTGGSFQSG